MPKVRLHLGYQERDDLRAMPKLQGKYQGQEFTGMPEEQRMIPEYKFMLFGIFLGFIIGWRMSDTWYDIKHYKKNWKESDL